MGYHNLFNSKKQKGEPLGPPLSSSFTHPFFIVLLYS